LSVLLTTVFTQLCTCAFEPASC